MSFAKAGFPWVALSTWDNGLAFPCQMWRSEQPLPISYAQHWHTSCSLTHQLQVRAHKMFQETYTQCSATGHYQKLNITEICFGNAPEGQMARGSLVQPHKKPSRVDWLFTSHLLRNLPSMLKCQHMPRSCRDQICAMGRYNNLTLQIIVFQFLETFLDMLLLIGIVHKA